MNGAGYRDQEPEPGTMGQGKVIPVYMFYSKSVT